MQMNLKSNPARFYTRCWRRCTKFGRPLLVLLGIMAFTFIMMAKPLLAHGSLILIPRSMKRLNLTPSEVVNALAEHKFLFIGGPHKAGTTILWECLRTHSKISGFIGATDSDYSEGIFLQTVYPSFGIGKEFMRMRRRRTRTSLPTGLGQYALNPRSHLTENASQVTPLNLVRLFNEWAFYWDLSRPVLLEKSPPNVVISRFLQQMFNKSDTYFLFITRHPITNALSHLHTGCCPGMTMRELITHWVRQHEILHQDLPRLKHSKLIRYENFSRAPRSHLRVVHEWLGVYAEDLAVEVTPASIDKYEREYCEGMRARGAVARHKQLSVEFGERVRRFGYDLDAFECLQDILKHH